MLDWLNSPWASQEKEACEFLDTLDLKEFLFDYYVDVEDLKYAIIWKYPEAEKVLTTLTYGEFYEYLQDRYQEEVSMYEETITNYYIRKND